MFNHLPMCKECLMVGTSLLYVYTPSTSTYLYLYPFIDNYETVLSTKIPTKLHIGNVRGDCGLFEEGGKKRYCSDNNIVYVINTSNVTYCNLGKREHVPRVTATAVFFFLVTIPHRAVPSYVYITVSTVFHHSKYIHSTIESANPVYLRKISIAGTTRY